MKWTCERPRYWTGSDGTNTAVAHKIREGMIHCSDWMWSTTLNGEWVTNADTLADAKRAVTEELAK